MHHAFLLWWSIHSLSASSMITIFSIMQCNRVHTEQAAEAIVGIFLLCISFCFSSLLQQAFNCPNTLSVTIQPRLILLLYVHFSALSKLVRLCGFITQSSIGYTESPITNTGTSTPFIVLDVLDCSWPALVLL